MADEKTAVCSPDRKRHEADYCVVEKVVHREGEGADYCMADEVPHREGEGEGADYCMADEGPHREGEGADCCVADEVPHREGEGTDCCVADEVPHREGEGADYCVAEEVPHREGDQKICLPVDRADDSESEKDDDSQVGFVQDYAEITLKDRFDNFITDSDFPNVSSDLENFFEEERKCRLDFVCKIPHVPHKFPHSVMFLGDPARQVFSITIYRMWKLYPDPGCIKIHGVIRLLSDGMSTELFERSEDEAVEFNSRERKLTLPLQGPNMPWAFDAERGQTFVCLLKCNGVDIFEAPSHSLFQRGCSLFAKDDEPVGCGIITFPPYSSPIPGLLRKNFRGRDQNINSLFVQAKIRTMVCGMLAVLKFTALHDLSLYGKITARSCLTAQSIVLFKEKQKAKKVGVKSWIPLSRSMIAVDIRSSLLIKIGLFDGNTNEKLVNETLQFNVQKEETSSEKITWNEAIKVEVDWILPE